MARPNLKTKNKMIEKLFTSKNRVKLMEYFILNNKDGRLREISRDLKMPVSALSRELKNLLELGIIKKQRNVFSENKGCNYIDDLANILIKTDSFRFELEKAINKNLDFSFVFGSFANNNYNPNSDIDLFVVGEISNFSLNKKLKPVEKKIGREINPVIWPLNDLKSKSQSSFIRNIRNNKIIMVKGTENELRKIIGRR